MGLPVIRGWDISQESITAWSWQRITTTLGNLIGPRARHLPPAVFVACFMVVNGVRCTLHRDERVFLRGVLK